MIHTSGNYSYQEPPFKDGDTVRGGNMSQHTPGTAICKGVKNVVVEGGNWTNCAKPESWTVRGGNWCQISRCTHLMDTIPKGMKLCADDCEHRSAGLQDVEITREEAAKLKTVAKAYVESERVAKDGLGEKVFTERRYVYRDAVQRTLVKPKAVARVER